MPADMCTALAQDARGFLWIGTQSGALRWDGQHFKLHPPPPGASYVRTLLATRDGRVWAGTFSGGIVVYDASGEAAHFERELSHARVEGLAEDRDGRVWAGTQEGLDRIDPRTKRVERVLHDRVRGLLVDREGNLWIGSSGGLMVRRGNAFQRVPGLEHDFVTKFFEDDRGRIWLGTADRGAAVLDPRTGALRRIAKLSHFWIYGITEVPRSSSAFLGSSAGVVRDRLATPRNSEEPRNPRNSPSEIWLATFGGGIDVVDADSLEVIDRLRNDPVLPNTIGGDRIGALLRDRSGVVWVGTWGQGIARHDPSTRAFRTIRHSPNRPEGLSHPAAVRAMQMSDGNVWVGTNGNGVDVLDGALRRIHNYPLGAVTCLAEGKDGTRYVATLDGALHRMRRGASSFEKVQGLPGGPIRAMTFGPGGELWAGSSEGLARIDEKGVRAYRHNRDDPMTLSGYAVEAIAFTPDGTMWVGTDNGLNVFDPARGTATRIIEGLPNNWVPDLMVARDGRLWVGTHAGACIVTSWDGKRAAFERVADRLKRPPAPVEALIQDDEGQVWLGARLRVDPARWTAQEFGPGDGCDFRSFFIASRSRMSDGSLLFGSPEGLLVVQPKELKRWTYAPPVVVTSLRVDGEERPVGSTLTLEPDARGFHLDFAALDLTAPERNRYRYRLDPFDAGWNETDASRRSLAYTNLGAGEYRLRVQGTNRDGVWSPNELWLDVRVRPAFYETAWFRLLATAAAFALIYAIYRLRVRALAARSRRLERIVSERTLQLQEAYARIESASLTDPLTQLRNRRYLEQAIPADLQLSERRGEDLVVLLVDLDHFKSVNDHYGHAAGDAVLVQTADVMRALFRSSDHLVRWGGEEFLIVARFIDRGNGPELAEKLRAAVEDHSFALPDGTGLRRTCSIGVSAWPTPGMTWEQVIDLADQALYEAKRGGRNRYRLSETSFAGIRTDRLEVLP